MILRSLRCSIHAQSPVVLAFLLWSFSSATFVLAQRPGNVLERDSARADTGKKLDLIDIGKRLLHIKPSKPRAASKKVFTFQRFLSRLKCRVGELPLSLRRQPAFTWEIGRIPTCRSYPLLPIRTLKSVSAYPSVRTYG